MENEKVPLEVALGMSLEEYIHKAGIVNPNLRPKMKQQQKRRNSPVDKPKHDDDVPMEMNNNEDMPHDTSPQWRLYPPNNSAARVPGMPPAIPVEAHYTQKSLIRRQRGASNTNRWKFNDEKFTKDCEAEELRRRRFRGIGVRPWTNNRNRSRFSQNERNNRNANRRPQNQSQNNRRTHSPVFEVTVPPVSPSNQSADQSAAPIIPSIMQNQVFGLQSNNGGCGFNSMAGSTSGSFRNNLFGAGPNSMSSYMASAGGANTAAGCNGGGGAGGAGGSDVNDLTNNMLAISSMMNVSKMANLPLMPLAGKLFETIEAVQSNFSKKYDMKMQKEISKIQGREMMYKCGGVEGVVSFDGPGVDVVTKLHTTDVTMNQRFA